MKRFKVVAAIISLSAFIYTAPVVKASEPLVWLPMEVTEEVNKVVNTDTIWKKQEPVALVAQPKVVPVILEKNDAVIDTDIMSAIQEIKKRRQEDDALLARLLEKQKEQEAAKKEQERKQQEAERQKLLETVTTLQKKQKEETESQLVALIKEIKAQQEIQQNQQNENLLNVISTLKTQSDNQAQSELAKQLGSLQAAIEGLKPQTPPARIIPVPLDDPQYAKKTIQQNIIANTQDATDASVREADINFFYSPGALFKIYCKEGYLTDVQLQPGEEIQYIGGGDTVRWVIDRAQSGTGAEKTWHIYIKPLRPGLETNIVINTDKHSYQIQAQSTSWYNPIVRWSYPQEAQSAFYRQQEKQRQLDEDTIMSNGSPEKLNFDYAIKGGSYSWTPTLAFDDGLKTYIKMPASLSTGEAPALFIKDGRNIKLVNYRIKNNYYVVDRLFKEAELRVGKNVVRIKQN